MDDASINATCPTITNDTDGDNLISVAEGMPAYGAIQLALAPFPTATEQTGMPPLTPLTGGGDVNDAQTFRLGQDGNPTLDELGNPANRVIVLHGLARNGMYETTRPVAGGQIELVQLQSPPEEDGGTDVNVAFDGGRGAFGLSSLLALLGMSLLTRRRALKTR